eukprot:2531780-Karenia_brevis.AAC.1
MQCLHWMEKPSPVQMEERERWTIQGETSALQGLDNSGQLQQHILCGLQASPSRVYTAGK